ncbi:hypothetical protein [Paenibacillus riograndensis]|uniref:hypothetical protein n=1 Tax=Paenibacillus riograndensis TaxID=483937 RepID=UPI000764443E|nr:hypothetical protein [Paenibacillus riograndensis]
MNLQNRLSTVEHRIREACGRCGRSEGEIQIIAVTKFTSMKTVEQVLLSGIGMSGKAVRKKLSLNMRPSIHEERGILSVICKLIKTAFSPRRFYFGQ